LSNSHNHKYPFSKNKTLIKDSGEIHCYVGQPSCNVFYKWILENLEEQLHAGFGPPHPPLTKISSGQMGNLGESMAFLVGRFDRFSSPHFLAVLGGALTPFNSGTVIGVDIMIVYLDPNGNVENDRLFIQEMKTTCASDLNYSKELIDDYEKLLDTTKPSLSLMSRVSSLKAKLNWEHNYPNDLIQRVEDLAQPCVESCTRIRLLPTLIHDRNSDPVQALTHVLTEIQQQGWSQECIEAWSISLTRLEQCLLHMANRLPFSP
tara:strand:+ start:19843 stop:20628 length:786 start_codon:yes stop_codon:yes gene_type:complete